MLRAIIFDFNGIILDDEPFHFRAMCDAVAQVGITITKEEYWNSYLPLDDWRCLAAICRAHTVELDPEQREAILIAKSQNYRRLLRDQIPLFPGAVHFVRSASQHYPLALASGARRDEIENTLQSAGLFPCFRVVVAAEDFTRGKPHPDSFLLALERLNESLNGQSSPIQPRECLVIEDAIGGVEGARAAGMRCMAVSNSYARAQLMAADRIVGSLEEVELDSLRGIFEELS